MMGMVCEAEVPQPAAFCAFTVRLTEVPLPAVLVTVGD